MTENDQHIWFNIAATPGLGPAAAQKIAQYLNRERLGPSSLRDLGESELQSEVGLTAGVAAALLTQLASPVAVPGVREEIKLLTPGDDRFPNARFLNANPPLPAVLYAAGDSALLAREGAAIAIAGSRDTGEEILELVHELARAASELGWLTVSGLARGVDSAAHQGAIRGGAGTIGVLASGIEKSSGAWLPDDLEATCIVSQFAPQEPWSGPRAMQRNPTIAGLADRVLVAAADTSGGSWEMAQLCLKRHKPLFVLDLPTDLAPGNQALIRSGAIPVDSARPLDALADTSPDAPTLFE